MNELTTQLEAYDWGGDRGALSAIDDQIVAAGRDGEKLAAIEDSLIEVLRHAAKLPAKEYVCRKLALIGTDRCISTLLEMLSDAELADRALFALQAIPAGAAGDGLRKALEEADGTVRVGIVNALGERRDQMAVPALEALQNGPDTVLSAAAESALGKIKPPT